MKELSYGYKRIGIFVFYDAEGKVDDYILVLLYSMMDICQKLVIVINGNIEKNDYFKLKNYSHHIFVRENYGYDAGAYKDVFIKLLSDENWAYWDEIILFNDTFYGPIFSWKFIFDHIETEKMDFWGLSRYPGSRAVNNSDIDIPPHIQGYFLVCKKKMFLSPHWLDFWNNLEYPKTYQEAIEKFEVHFSVFFSNRGFRNMAFTDHCQINIDYGKNPYLHYPYELIRCEKFPIIKRKAIILNHFDEIKKAFNYIKNNTEYRIDYIISHLARLTKENRVNLLEPFDPIQLELFYGSHKKIYIYGHGNFGKGMAAYFEYKGWKYEGFIVTADNEKDRKLFIYCNIDFEQDDGVILALGEKAFSEVYPIVKESLDEYQLCCPSYDRNI